MKNEYESLDPLAGAENNVESGVSNPEATLSDRDKEYAALVAATQDRIAQDVQLAVADRPDLPTLGQSIGVPHEEVLQADKATGFSDKLGQIDGEISTLVSSTNEKIQPSADSVAKSMEAENAAPSATEQVQNPTGAEAKEAGAENGGEKDEIIGQAGEKRAGKLRRLLTTAIRLTPVVGGIEMMGEAAVGTTLDGQKLTGTDRVIEGAMGAAALGLDLTVAGAGASEGIQAGEAAILAGRSTGILEKAGAKLGEKGAPKAMDIIKKTVDFMKKHPEATERAEKAVDNQIKVRIRDYRKNGPQPSETQPDLDTSSTETAQATQPPVIETAVDISNITPSGAAGIRQAEDFANNPANSTEAQSDKPDSNDKTNQNRAEINA